jgi:hypothetical protein
MFARLQHDLFTFWCQLDAGVTAEVAEKKGFNAALVVLVATLLYKKTLAAHEKLVQRQFDNSLVM